MSVTPQFRQAMTWVHTWFGLVLGFVLMVCFFFGTLAVFDREIDRWAIPESRFAPQHMPSFDRVLRPILAHEVLPDEKAFREFAGSYKPERNKQVPTRAQMVPESFWIYTTHRDPVLSMGAQFRVPDDAKAGGVVYGEVAVDPRNGRPIAGDPLAIGSRWFYPMHINLHLDYKRLGMWIVGLAALMMLAGLVTGVIIHKKIFRELFTFRPQKQTLRSTLDMHNLSGVAALPFHFFFAFTGLLIFSGTYFPIGSTVLAPLAAREAKLEAARTGLPESAAGIAAPMAPVDAMVATARARWAARGTPAEPGYINITHVGDINGYVSIYPMASDAVSDDGGGLHFSAVTGKLLREDPPPGAIGATTQFLSGLHLIRFRHWLLRWLYVGGGLLGCVCIATGFMFFVEKRKAKHAKSGSQASRVVDALAVFAVTGIVVASLAMLVANRLLPVHIPHRNEWEEWIFWGAWLACFVHGAVRSAPVAQGRMSPAWREQALVIAALAIAAVLLNWITTGDHLLKTLVREPYMPVAGVDLALLATAGIAALAASRLARRERAGGRQPVARRPARAPLAEGVTATEAIPVATHSRHG